MSSKPSKYPNGAFKLLVMLLYGKYPYMERGAGRGIVTLHSLRKLADRLGCRSVKIRLWLQWLEDQGYIESLAISQDRRRASFRVREPSSVIYE